MSSAFWGETTSSPWAMGDRHVHFAPTWWWTGLLALPLRSGWACSLCPLRGGRACSLCPYVALVLLHIQIIVVLVWRYFSLLSGPRAVRCPLEKKINFALAPFCCFYGCQRIALFLSPPLSPFSALLVLSQKITLLFLRPFLSRGVRWKNSPPPRPALGFSSRTTLFRSTGHCRPDESTSSNLSNLGWHLCIFWLDQDREVAPFFFSCNFRANGLSFN